jgi:hypothetical protein
MSQILPLYCAVGTGVSLIALSSSVLEVVRACLQHPGRHESAIYVTVALQDPIGLM